MSECGSKSIIQIPSFLKIPMFTLSSRLGNVAIQFKFGFHTNKKFIQQYVRSASAKLTPYDVSKTIRFHNQFDFSLTLNFELQNLEEESKSINLM